ncbi:MAG: DUF4097 family beta strand repeat protein [Flavobacteriaceae bacterium]|uniref:DUF4097 family beta strand repeat-containing protein n=1 Tax=Flagellimonas algarum TaxID=3230298 RepID=UPI003390E720|nr:DUF4097 family beta strand repeat protein [Flavobacteriaceae bacterium]
MKRLTTLLLVCAVATIGYAQNDYSKSLNGIDWVKIESKADVTVKTHDKNEILIKSGKAKGTPDRAKGLKLVGQNGGTDNTDVGFYVVQDGNNLIVKNLRKSDRAEIYLPKTQKVSVKTTWHGNMKISGFSSEIEANAQLNGSVYIENVNGPVTANALNGTVEVIFDAINQASPISIFTTNGTVDVSLPQNTPANLSMSSWNGDVYSNFDISKPSKEGMRSVAGRKVTGVINNGGVDIKLRSTNGNIYLRKK